MGSRYFITGVQLGILKALIPSEIEDSTEQIIKLLEEIEEDQYLGDREMLDRMKKFEKEFSEP